VVAQALVVQDEAADRAGQLGALPPALGLASCLRLGRRGGGAGGLDRVGGGAEVVGGDVRDAARLPGGVRGVAGGAPDVPGGAHGVAAGRAGPRHRHLAAGPGAGMFDGGPWARVAGAGGLEQGQDVLGAQRRPQGEETVVVVGEGAAAPDRDEPRVAFLREDHRRVPSVPSAGPAYRRRVSPAGRVRQRPRSSPAGLVTACSV